jgi:hypothetical protein
VLLFALAFWAGNHVAWLAVVIVGFNLFFSPLVPLTDALANTWQKQITMDYGRVRLWGQWRLLSARRLPVNWSACLTIGRFCCCSASALPLCCWGCC